MPGRSRVSGWNGDNGWKTGRIFTAKHILHYYIITYIHSEFQTLEETILYSPWPRIIVLLSSQKKPIKAIEKNTFFLLWFEPKRVFSSKTGNHDQSKNLVQVSLLNLPCLPNEPNPPFSLDPSPRASSNSRTWRPEEPTKALQIVDLRESVRVYNLRGSRLMRNDEWWILNFDFHSFPLACFSHHFSYIFFSDGTCSSNRATFASDSWSFHGSKTRPTTKSKSSMSWRHAPKWRGCRKGWL